MSTLVQPAPTMLSLLDLPCARVFQTRSCKRGNEAIDAMNQTRWLLTATRVGTGTSGRNGSNGQYRFTCCQLGNSSDRHQPVREACDELCAVKASDYRMGNFRARGLTRPPSSSS